MSRPRRRKSTRRASCLFGATAAAAAAVLALSGIQSTGALWATQDTVSPGSLGSGTLDLKLRPSSSTGTFADTVTIPAASLTGMLPGDSRAFTMSVRSDSIAAPMSYQVFGRTAASAEPDANVLGNALQTSIWVTGGAAVNPGSPTTGYRTDQFGTALGASCPAGTQVGPTTTLSVTAATLLTPAASATLQPNGVSNLCLTVTLPSDASGAAMGKSASLTLRVLGRSVER